MDNVPAGTGKHGGGIWRGVLLLVIAAASTVGLYYWGRETIALPVCAAVAKADGMELVGYRPIDPGVRTRQAPDGECLMKNADGQIVPRSLSRYLHGWQNITSFALAYDIVFIVMSFAWGALLGALMMNRRHQ